MIRVSRRHLLVAGLASAATSCVRSPEPIRPDLSAFLAELSFRSASAVPLDPSSLAGRVVLITFIATWCFPCLTELVVVDKLERTYAAAGFANVLVGMDLEGFDVLVPFAASYQLKVPLLAADDRLRAGETRFGRIRELPTRVLFARTGTPVVAFAGVSNIADLDHVVAAEVAKRP